jgi:3-oxoacyl-[acyl-carrier-protein] synthase II
MTGHLLGAAGAVESIATVLALHHRTAPPTVNLETRRRGRPRRRHRRTPRGCPTATLVALNNSFGFGGHNVALAFRSV